MKDADLIFGRIDRALDECDAHQLPALVALTPEQLAKINLSNAELDEFAERWRGAIGNYAGTPFVILPEAKRAPWWRRIVRKLLRR